MDKLPDQEKVKQYRDQVEARKKAEAEKAAPTPEKEITSKSVRDCLEANELGDGALFAEIYRDQFVYDKTARRWMYWKGHHWGLDDREKVLEAVEDGPVRHYLREAGECDKRKQKASDKGNKQDVQRWENWRNNLYKRVKKIRTCRGRDNCLTMAHSCPGGLSVTADEIDQKPRLLACPNGVIDLKTGTFADGKPDHYLLKACNVEFKGLDEPRDVWNKTLLQIYSDRKSLVEFVQRVCGSALFGGVKEHIITVFSGQGRNGKGSIIVGMLSHVLGRLAGPIPQEMLLSQHRFSSSSPTPDIMSLRGLRLAFASETDEYAKFSAARVKWLTGGDELVGRNPHDKYPTTFLPSHTLFLLTNNKPQAPPNDYAFWERVLIVSHEISFVNREPREEYERRADLDLPEKLKIEASGILAWLVEGYLLWQKKGLSPPPIVKQAVAEYRRNEDILSDFLDECCEIGPELNEGASVLYDCFENWWTKNVSKNPPKQRRFGQWLGMRFEKQKIKGVYVYDGISLQIE